MKTLAREKSLSVIVKRLTKYVQNMQHATTCVSIQDMGRYFDISVEYLNV